MLVACGQMNATTMDAAAAVWPAVERLAAQAADLRADLLVLPETTYPAYWLESAERYRAPDIERTGAVLDRFSRLAKRFRLWLVAGFVEERGEALFNSAAVFDRAGTPVGVARKNLLWDCDNRWFAPGDALSVFDTEFGRMGVLICADGRMPEISATLAARGAEFMVMPTAWVNADAWTGEYRNAQADFLIRARAMEFAVPFACASKAGREDRNLEYVGQSQIVSAVGGLLAVAPIEGEALIAAELTPRRATPPAIDDADRAVLLEPGREYPRNEKARPIVVPRGRDCRRLSDLIQSAGGRCAILTADDLRSFAPARRRMLEGAEVLLVEGAACDEAFVRTRAAENRVFVILADARIRMAADPSGRLIGLDPADDAGLTLDLHAADVKRFTPETDFLSQRRVACYELPESRAPGAASQSVYDKSNR